MCQTETNQLRQQGNRLYESLGQYLKNQGDYIYHITISLKKGLTHLMAKPHTRPHSVSTGLTEEEFQSIQQMLEDDLVGENKYGGNMAPFLRELIRAKLKKEGYRVGRESYGRGKQPRYDLSKIRKKIGEWEKALENLDPNSVAWNKRNRELKILHKTLEKLEDPEYRALTKYQREVAKFAKLVGTKTE